MTFELNKLKNYRRSKLQDSDDLIDIKLPSELAAAKMKTDKFRIFVVDDDPYLLQSINTQLSEIIITEHSNNLEISVSIYASGRSVLRDMHLRPDLIFLNPDVNHGIKNALTGVEIVDEIMNINSYQPIVLLGDFEGNDSNLLVDPDLRNQILAPIGAEHQLTEILQSLVIP
ncbi:MAG: hypothetical protein ACFB2Y_01890 [Fulvivirga sp.]